MLPEEWEYIKTSFHFEKNKLVVLHNPTFDEWVRAGNVLHQIKDGLHFWIGDWLNYGEEHYGEKYSQAMDITGLEIGTLQNVCWVSRRIESSRRRESLSFGHHQNVARMDNTQQEKWLTEAENNKWSVSQMREEITSSVRYSHSKAEESFYEYIADNFSNIRVTKKGLPDFMVINSKEEIVGFVEVKRDDLGDNLTYEQILFKNFCKKQGIAYQMWEPIMLSHRWKTMSEDMKRRFLGGEELKFYKL